MSTLEKADWQQGNNQGGHTTARLKPSRQSRFFALNPRKLYQQAVRETASQIKQGVSYIALHPKELELISKVEVSTLRHGNIQASAQLTAIGVETFVSDRAGTLIKSVGFFSKGAKVVEAFKASHNLVREVV